MKPLSHSPKPRARLPRGWRKSAGVAGVLSAAAFFAAAQAGSLQPIQVEVAGLLNPLQDNSPSAKVHSPKSGAHRSYASGGGSRGGEYVGGARAPDAAN